MTPNTSAIAELEKEHATSAAKFMVHVANVVHKHQNSDSGNNSIDNTVDPRITEQYEAFLTDPRRI